MWEQALLALADRVAALAGGEGLPFERIQGALEPGEPYAQVAVSSHERLVLEPAEWAERSFPATVWLYNYPTMGRVRLVGPDAAGEWAVRSADGVPFHRNLDAPSFRHLVHDLSLRAA